MRIHSLYTSLTALILGGSAVAVGANAPERPSYGAELEGFDYPFPVQRYEFTSQQQTLAMAYMDLVPAKPNGRSVVLLHGKNFCGATWEGAARPLQAAGYRVLIPDQIGFCKSSKPAAYQFSFNQLAANTHALIEKLGIERPIVIGHSMGGMLAMRYALQYPQALQALVLVNPIGLEDWLQKGVPYRSVDQWYEREQKTTAAGIRQYQLNTYYDGQWRPGYDRWVDMLAGMYQGAGGKQVAWNQALTADMVLTQPVIHEVERIRTPTLLLIGEKDNTAIGKDAAPPDVATTLGNYPKLAREVTKRIPKATLITFDDLGHSPQVQSPTRFNEVLLQQLERLSTP